MLTTIENQYKTIWTDFTVLDEASFNTELTIETIEISDLGKLAALNFGKYVGYDGFGYGEGAVSRGITEQEAYNVWIDQFEKQLQVYRRQLKSYGITELPQCVYDGLMLYFWAVNKIHFVYANETTYDMRQYIIDKDWDTVASMMMRSKYNKEQCIKAATMLRLADYGKNKPRSWFRTQGIHAMRSNNETALYSQEELKRARFAYYAETRQFLPFTPEGNKRQLVKEYENTLLTNKFVYDGTTTTFTIPAAPSMSPVEKLEVYINGDLVQNVFDYVISGTQIIVTKSLKDQDIINTIIRI